MRKETDSRPLLREQEVEKEIPPEVSERFENLVDVLPRRALAFLAEAKTGGLCGISESVVGIAGLPPGRIFEESVFGWMTPEAEEQIRNKPVGVGRETEFEIECRISTWRGQPVVIQTAISLMVAGEEQFLIGVGVENTEAYMKRQQLERDYEKLSRLALVDDLTDLYNRRGFTTLGQQQLEIARRIGATTFFVFTDFNGLKDINDAFGHPVGDRALREVAMVLRRTCREADIVARVGGDEFVVVGVETSENSGETLVVRLQEALAAHNAGTDNPYQISLSFGLASDDPDNPCPIEELLRKADQAMYEVKRKKGEP